ncbi:hypothetical protein J6Q66_06485 [bacterium]|nr:hypothetical protein [bacterium]
MKLLELFIILRDKGIQIFLIFLFLGLLIPSDMLLFEIYYKILGILFFLYLLITLYKVLFDKN